MLRISDSRNMETPSELNRNMFKVHAKTSDKTKEISEHLVSPNPDWSFSTQYDLRFSCSDRIEGIVYDVQQSHLLRGVGDSVVKS